MRYELRIGNITEQGVVDAIHPDRAEVIKDKARDFLLYDALKPIPLTEEWLMKFGFEHEGQAIGRLRLDC